MSRRLRSLRAHQKHLSLLYGITSERRLLEEVRMHLAYRWFSRLGFEQEIPDHSTFSKNRHGRFRQSGVFRKVFEEIVHRCLEAGLVEGQNLAVDGTLVGANASRESRVPREKPAEIAQVSQTVQEFLAELEQQNPVADPEDRVMPQQMVSTTDPDAAWAVKSGGPATLAYFDNYLVDTASRVILSVEATPAASVKKRWLRGECWNIRPGLGFGHRALRRIRHMEAESFWRGCWNAISNRIFQSSIVGTKHGGASP